LEGRNHDCIPVACCRGYRDRKGVNRMAATKKAPAKKTASKAPAKKTAKKK
jgi:hypothetical protein